MSDKLSPDDLRGDLGELAWDRSRLKTLNDFAIELLSIPTREGLVWYVAREVVARLGFVDCVVYLLEPERGVIRQVAAIGAKNPQGREIVNALEIPVGQGITGTVMRGKTPILVDDLLEDERYIPDIAPARSEVCVPLLIDGAAVGVIDCEHPAPRHFGQEHLELLSTVAAMASAKLKLIESTERADRQTSTLRRLNDQLRKEMAARGRIEAALRHSEERFRSVIDNSPSAIYMKDLKGRFRLVNRRFEEWFGIPGAEMIGKAAEDIFTPIYADRYLDMDRQVIARRATCVRELKTNFADRSVHRLLVTKFPVTRPDGTLDGVGTISIDITERILAEERLRESEERLRQTTRLAKIGYYVWDAVADRCLFCSEEHARIHGLTPEQYVARASVLDGAFSLTHPEDRERVRDAMKALRAGESIEIAYRTLTPEGEVRHVRELGKPIFGDDGSVVQEIGSSQDVTEATLAEERLRQAQKMEAVGQLTGGVAHDFNNLLAVIQGNAELLGDNAEDTAELRDEILRAASRGAALTQRLLAFSRQQPLRPQAVDLEAVVGGMSGLMRRMLGATIEIETASVPGLWEAYADAGQLENALLNLAINARDAMPEGGRLRIECRNEQLDATERPVDADRPSGDFVLVTVSDSGTGMPASVLEHVFEPFFTTKAPGEGSGLGLSMVYGFAKQSGGHVSVRSEEGRGTTVRIYLPRVADAAEPAAADPVQPAPRGDGELILVIEDDDDVRALAVRMLRDLDYRTIDVPEASAAQAVLDREEPIDLVLADVVLPGATSGPQFVTAVRAERPALKVVFMSGYPAPGGALGRDEILLDKPFQREQLALALRQALSA